MTRTLPLACALALGACAGHAAEATAPRIRTEPPAATEVKLAARDERPTRRQAAQRILPHNVRVMVYEAGEAKRTASGVVLGRRVERGMQMEYVVTNTHVVERREGEGKLKFTVVVDGRKESREYDAELAATGKVPEMDLAVLEVAGLDLPPAELATDDELDLGNDVVVASAPYGHAISLSGGLVSYVEYDPQSGAAQLLKTDAPIGYGASGGGVYAQDTGRLVAVVEGYRTARIDFNVAKDNYAFDVPMPGETFGSPAAKIRSFLGSHGLGWILAQRASP